MKGINAHVCLNRSPEGENEELNISNIGRSGSVWLELLYLKGVYIHGPSRAQTPVCVTALGRSEIKE